MESSESTAPNLRNQQTLQPMRLTDHTLNPILSPVLAWFGGGAKGPSKADKAAAAAAQKKAEQDSIDQKASMQKQYDLQAASMEQQRVAAENQRVSYEKSQKDFQAQQASQAAALAQSQQQAQARYEAQQKEAAQQAAAMKVQQEAQAAALEKQRQEQIAAQNKQAEEMKANQEANRPSPGAQVDVDGTNQTPTNMRKKGMRKSILAGESNQMGGYDPSRQSTLG